MSNQEESESSSKKTEKSFLTKIKKELYLNNSSKGILDAFQEKIISRKLLVFLAATGLLIGSGLDPDTWGLIAMSYIGGQSAIDIVQVWKYGKQL
jgi:hypothetical protein